MCQISSGRNQKVWLLGVGGKQNHQKQDKSNPVFPGQIFSINWSINQYLKARNFHIFFVKTNKLRINFISSDLYWWRWILTICWTLKRSGVLNIRPKKGAYFVCSPAVAFGWRIRMSSPKQIGMKDMWIAAHMKSCEIIRSHLDVIFLQEFIVRRYDFTLVDSSKMNVVQRCFPELGYSNTNCMVYLPTISWFLW